jgi:lipid A 3-O-deacylase
VASSVLTCLAFNTSALAGDSFVDEARIGIYDHDSELFASRAETSDPDINVELLFKAPEWLQWLAKPRINLGANINTGNGTSMAYSGLVWDYDFTDTMFIEGGFGGAIHDGETHQQTATNLNLGCRVLFHENVSLGYRVTNNSSIMITVDHMSNAGLCSPNPGLTDIGLRYGYTF